MKHGLWIGALAWGVAGCYTGFAGGDGNGVEVATAVDGPSESGPSSDGAPESSSGAGPADDGSSSEASTRGATGTGDPPAGATDENLRVAFFGDHGLNNDSLDTLNLVINEQADFLVVLGDFDYQDNPTGWDMQLDEGLAGDFPVFAAAGNHDVSAWDGYSQLLQDRLVRISGADCSGELGVNMACNYRGLFFILSGVGTMGSGHEEFIESELASDESIWRVCAWHKNQNDMQAGGKGDEVGWEAYQKCMEGGAIIATGHEHSYARTQTLTDLGNETNGHGATGEHGTMEVGLGSTFVFVAGLGGTGIRDYHADEHDDDTWWSTIYTYDHYRRDGEVIDDFHTEPGVLFVDFYVEGDPYKAHAYFKNIAGEVIDEFDIVAQR